MPSSKTRLPGKLRTPKKVRARQSPAQNSGGHNGLLLPIGHGSYVAASKLIAVLNSNSSPIKRLVHDAKKQRTLKDATHGRHTRSVLIMENGDIVLSALNTDTLGLRYDHK